MVIIGKVWMSLTQGERISALELMESDNKVKLEKRKKRKNSI